MRPMRSVAVPLTAFVILLGCTKHADSGPPSETQDLEDVVALLQDADPDRRATGQSKAIELGPRVLDSIAAVQTDEAFQLRDRYRMLMQGDRREGRVAIDFFVGKRGEGELAWIVDGLRSESPGTKLDAIRILRGRFGGPKSFATLPLEERRELVSRAAEALKEQSLVATGGETAVMHELYLVELMQFIAQAAEGKLPPQDLPLEDPEGDRASALALAEAWLQESDPPE